MHSVDSRIGEWRAAVASSPAVSGPDADELEGHLREHIAGLEANGLTSDEAFLIGVRRLAEVDPTTAEYARAHSDRLWKQLAIPVPNTRGRSSLPMMLGFAALTAVLVHVLRVLAESGKLDLNAYVLNISVVVLPVLAGYFMVRRRMRWHRTVLAFAVIAALVVVVNLFPMGSSSASTILVAIHLPVLLWVVVGFAYLGGDIRSSAKRMDFVRFSGEWLIYYSLIALGGGVLLSLTSLILVPFGAEANTIVFTWLPPSGAVAAVIVAAWLVEAKKSVIENLAPVLTAIFTPLFASMLIVAATAYVVTGVWRDFDRGLLVGFDVLLLVVVALIVYGISARDSTKKRGAMDVIRLVAVAAAILLDVLILVSLFSRIGEYGFTANRVAVLGLNLILLVNLTVTVWHLAHVVVGRAPAAKRLEGWQTSYLPVFAAWALVVVIVLPPLFGFA